MDRFTSLLSGWLEFANTGDVARVILAPIATARAIYGSPITAGGLVFLERLLNGGDIAVVQSFNRKLVVMPEESFLAIMEARNAD